MAKNCEVCGREFSALYPKTSFEKHEVCKVCKKRLEISEKNFDEVRKEKSYNPYGPGRRTCYR